MVKICQAGNQWDHFGLIELAFKQGINEILSVYQSWPGVVIFADIIKLVTIFIKTITKDSRKVKENGNYASKSNLYVDFLM